MWGLVFRVIGFRVIGLHIRYIMGYIGIMEKNMEATIS